MVGMLIVIIALRLEGSLARSSIVLRVDSIALSIMALRLEESVARPYILSLISSALL